MTSDILHSRNPRNWADDWWLAGKSQKQRYVGSEPTCYGFKWLGQARFAKPKSPKSMTETHHDRWWRLVSES